MCVCTERAKAGVMGESQKVALHTIMTAYTMRWRELDAMDHAGWSQAEHYEITHISHMLRILGDLTFGGLE
jgi:hypothetical protein